MASAIIHICVAKRVNDIINKEKHDLYLGAIAPDISKLVGETKEKSHFLDQEREDSLPNIDRFLEKYKKELHNSFELGYYIHLLTDKYWFGEFIYKYIDKLSDLDGEDYNYTSLKREIYSDYSALNIPLIDHYNLELYLFANEIVFPTSPIMEIPMDKLDLLVTNVGKIIQDSGKDYRKIINISDVIDFIEDSANRIVKEIENLEL